MTTRQPAPSLAGLAAATPDSRDRFVDFLRALSIGVVVLGHWLMAIVFFDGETLTGSNALETIPGMWILTWFLQVMPLFFFVGGFSNAVAYDALHRRGSGYGDFVRSRIERLMRPTVIFIGTWLLTAGVLELVFGLGGDLAAATSLLAKPLWFLAVYMIAIVVAPIMLWLHRRYRWGVPLTLVTAAALVDVTRIGFDMGIVGYLNFAFVWLLPHQLGYFYADGTLRRWRTRTRALAAAAGLASLALLVGTGIYSPSMVGMTTDKVSNNDPPSVCLIALTVWLIGAVMTVREPVAAWLQRRRVWTAVIAANSVIMTVFLWHLTALLCAVVVLYPLGFPQFAGGTLGWWATRPLWLAALTAFLVPFVLVFGRFERPRRADGDVRRPSPAWLVMGVALLVAGLGGFAQEGFAGIGSVGDGPLAGAPAPLLSAACVWIGMRMAAGGTRHLRQ